jgi:Domain of unknown function (DUF222)/HNH endonuclease
VAAERVLAVRRLVERLEGQWLKELATLDARGAAGAELGAPAPSTAGWLRARARMSAGAAGQRVRVARALHRGPLAGTAAALAAGELAYQHAAVLAGTTKDLDPQTTRQAEPLLLEAARRLDPGRLRRVAAHLRVVADPEAGATLLAALDPLTLLPPALGGAPPQLLDVGRATRVVPPALRRALAVRDQGCVVAGCQRPPAWCDAHHLRHWLHGGATSLDNLVLVCRAHHRAVHDGHQHLGRDPTGSHTLTQPPQRHPTAAA